MEISWVDSYYEALEFFYWEPQHIGRKKPVGARFDSADEANQHLRRIEVTLNHNFEQFFRLAPASLRNDLFAELFARPFEQAFTLHGRGVDDEFALEKVTQPDLLFVSAADVVALEMKISAKCSVEQILKYAVLGLAVELHFGTPRRHCLALLSDGAFARQWQEGFATPEEVRLALAEADLEAFLKRRPVRFQEHALRFTEIVSQLELAYLDYAGFAAFLRGAQPDASDTTAGAEVYRNLIAGLLAEMRSRQLAP
jgi:hypothetical protein